MFLGFGFPVFLAVLVVGGVPGRVLSGEDAHFWLFAAVLGVFVIAVHSGANDFGLLPKLGSLGARRVVPCFSFGRERGRSPEASSGIPHGQVEEYCAVQFDFPAVGSL